jgi:predicted metal-binding membrane protein
MGGGVPLFMAGTMAAMMAPTAAPFFVAYWRGARRPSGLVAVVLVYMAVWAAIGLALDYPMSKVVFPTSPLVAGTAVAVALVYAATPWGSWARLRCRQMSMAAPHGPRLGDAVAEGARYAACCVVCSAALMAVVIILGMSNPLVIVAGAAVMLAYKLVPWPAPMSFAGVRSLNSDE